MRDLLKLRQSFAECLIAKGYQCSDSKVNKLFCKEGKFVSDESWVRYMPLYYQQEYPSINLNKQQKQLFLEFYQGCLKFLEAV